jgi:HEPN domain-containing protein
VKAVLVQRQIPFPKSHDLERLMALLPVDLSLSSRLRRAAALTRYSEAGRYPHGFEDVVVEDYRAAVAMAKDVYGWAENVLKAMDEPGIRENKAVYRTRKVVRRKKNKPKHKARFTRS